MDDPGELSNKHPVPPLHPAGRRPRRPFRRLRPTTGDWATDSDGALAREAGCEVLIDGRVPALEYTCKHPRGCIILCPGSNGGVGPGVDPDHRGLPLAREHRQSDQARGAIYIRLAMELSSGKDADWEASPRMLQTEGMAAVLHMTWRGCLTGIAASSQKDMCAQVGQPTRAWPNQALKTCGALIDAVDDLRHCAAYMYSKYKVPVVLAGFSFGGAVIWPVARELHAVGALAGVVSIAGSARGGSRFRDHNIDTGRALVSLCEQPGTDKPSSDGVAGVANSLAGTLSPRLLWLHGTHDTNVPIDVSQHFFSKAAASHKTLAIVLGAEHMFDKQRDAVYVFLKDWLAETLSGSGGSRAVSQVLRISDTSASSFTHRCRPRSASSKLSTATSSSAGSNLTSISAPKAVSACLSSKAALSGSSTSAAASKSHGGSMRVVEMQRVPRGFSIRHIRRLGKGYNE
eukprot:gnl/TRDRNA2_/TRDRNA2_86279_c0_seq2.p1 gnl/TRDRNA2_/TRDRNA2_86279_c0~~gnl/TRDRNA2_/TRDRNA2_86279_c0_seq2.p1  ORF type:complete len:459 (+),score=51.20 gnl/TRDRNA2_/TRDRNA2_86279_c0_seq2:65-1441(+)